jgi:N-ethylmaleimide reductase
VRISPQNTQNDIADSDRQTLFNYVAEQLSGKGLAYLHIIEGDTSGIPVPPFDYKKLKRLFGGVVISNNGFDKQRANEAIARAITTRKGPGGEGRAVTEARRLFRCRQA